ncbi:MAG: hypothetical protein OEY97_01035 [Nitrospirota bacterium]|nr:hypothetical protein [Nitrospirota bacterium]
MQGKFLIWGVIIAVAVIAEIIMAQNVKVFGEDIGGNPWWGPNTPFMYILITYVAVWVAGGVLWYKDAIDDIDVDRKDPYLDNP